MKDRPHRVYESGKPRSASRPVVASFFHSSTCASYATRGCDNDQDHGLGRMGRLNGVLYLPCASFAS
eukprot:3177339-Amphidinium_carterae.1